MVTVTVIFFWISLAILFYCYIGYGILVFFITSLKQLFVSEKQNISSADTLPVTVVVTAYNEKKILEQKIANTLAIDYPSEQLQIIFITDGSTDGSEKIVQQHSSLISLHQPERRGKYAAIKKVALN